MKRALFDSGFMISELSLFADFAAIEPVTELVRAPKPRSPAMFLIFYARSGNVLAVHSGGCQYGLPLGTQKCVPASVV